MIRALFFLVLLLAVVLAAAWLAENPGLVVLRWRGVEVETSVAVVFVGLVLLAVAAVFADRIWRFVRDLPGRLRQGFAGRRERSGVLALARGFNAAAAGDAREAGRQARRAEELLDASPLPLLLSAQAADLAGNAEEARARFERLAGRPETAILGLRGLVAHALAEGDAERALHLAERAHALDPGGEWAATTLFDLEVRTRRFREAERTVRRMVRRGWLAEDEGRRRAALLLLAESEVKEAKGEADSALALAKKAAARDRSAPEAAARLASLLAREGRVGEAEKAVEAAWARAPHPDLVRAYAEIRAGEEPLSRVRRLERLLAKGPGHPVIHLALAAAAIDAGLWGVARRHLAIAEETERGAAVFRLHAELERKERGDEEAAERWLARAAEASLASPWACASCGARSPEYVALCPACGAFDRFAYEGTGRAAERGRAHLPSALPLAEPYPSAGGAGRAPPAVVDGGRGAG